MNKNSILMGKTAEPIYEYPHLLLEGLIIKQELEYLMSLRINEKGKLPLYVKLGSEVERVGMANLTTKFLSSILSIGVGGYSISIVKNKDNSIQLPLDDPYSILGFVTYDE